MLGPERTTDQARAQPALSAEDESMARTGEGFLTHHLQLSKGTRRGEDGGRTRFRKTPGTEQADACRAVC